MGNTLCNQLSNEDGAGSPPSMRRNLNSTGVVHGSEKTQQQTQQYHVSNQATLHDAHITKTNRKPSYITKIKNKSGGYLRHHQPSLTSSPPSSSSSSSSSISADFCSSAGFTTPESDQTSDVTGHQRNQQHKPAIVLHRADSVAPSSPSEEGLGSGATKNVIAFSRSHADCSMSSSKKIDNRNNSAFLTGETSSDDSENLSIDRMRERSNISADYQWLEGRRYHNTPGASYVFPNDID
ncbi:hypothetical protein EDD21DRAFT_41922, partial [Dissophora ornata]